MEATLSTEDAVSLEQNNLPAGWGAGGLSVASESNSHRPLGSSTVG